MGHNSEYRFADLKSCCTDSIKNTEAKLQSENNKEIVLIAYEKR